MKHLKTIFACLLMAVLSIGQVWAEVANPYTHTFASSDASTSAQDAKVLDGVTWSISAATYVGSDATKGLQIGSGSNPQNSTAWTMTTPISSFGESIQIDGIDIEISTASKGGLEYHIIAGDQDQTETLGATTSVTKKTLDCSANPVSSGDITISLLSKAAKAVYIKSITIRYSSADAPTVAVDGVTLDEDAITLNEEETQTLTATVSPDNATNKNVTWESDDESVATVANGVVTAVGAGDATITCKSVADETKYAECAVHVNASPYTKSTLIFTAACGGTGTADDDAEWAVTSDGAESVYDATSGIHYGTGSANVTYLQLATSDIVGSVAKVVVNARDAQATATISVTVGGTAFTCASATATNTSADYVFTGTGSGEIVVRVDRGSSMSKAIYVKSVVVTYVSDGKEAAGLAFDAAQKLAKVGGTLTAPNLSTADGFDGTVTYASSDEAVVKVNASTGAITEIVAVGKAVITAHSDETENFREGSASYTIFVAEQAGTNEDPLTEASAKALIDLGCEMEVHVHGTVLGSQDATKFTVTLAGGMQFYKLKDLGNVAFESAYIKNGDEVTAVGTLTKYNTTYELAEGCYLTAYTEYTEPLVDISNTKETAYTVAQALALATNPTSDLTKAVYIAGVVYDVKSFNSTNGTLDIYIKDAGEDNKFEFYKCAGIYDESLTAFTAADDVLVGDEVIGYGVMKYFSGGSIWEFDNTAGDYLVELTRPAVAVTGIDLTESTAEVEVGSTVTLHASVVPGNATDQGIEWSVTSGSDKASVDENGVVTGTAAGEAVIRAASHEDASIYEECTVTVTAVDPTKHTVTFDATEDAGESPLSKGNITFTCASGALNNGSEYRLYKNSETTFECSAGNITKIEFTGVSGNPVSGFEAPAEGTLVTDGNDGVWTGNAASVTFIASGAQVRATLIKITYKEDNREAAGLAWNPADDIEITVGDAFSAPALQNPNSIDASEISIESSNTSLATVTAGVVSLVADATGTATITATFAGNDDYKPATVSYNITVNGGALTDYYEKVTSGDVAEGTYLIVYEAGSLAFDGGADPLDAVENSIAVDIVSGNKIGVTSATEAATFYIDPTAGTIQAASGKYIGQTSDANGLGTSESASTYTNSFSFDEGNAVIVSSSAHLCYNSTSNQLRFRYYKSSSYSSQQPIALYKLANEVIKPASGLAWDPADDIELTVGDAFTAPTLLNPNSIDAAEISIESSNTDVATVTAGVVALVADATGEATITATFAGNASYKPATVSYKITVNPAYSIYVQPSLNVNFGSVEKDAALPADKTITVTLNNVATATATLGGTNPEAFSIDPATLTENGDITISVVSSATVANYAATLTISDEAGNAESKVVNLSFSVTEPAGEETPVSTTSKWVPATEITDGMQVLIVGVNNSDYFAMGAQANNGTGNNRLAVPASVDEGVLTPGENTMAFTVVEQPDGSYALQTSNDKYLYAASSSNNYLKTKDELDDNGKWTLSVTSAVANGTYTHKMMQFNSSSSIFACYTTSTTTQKPIALYVEQTTPPTPSYTTVRTDLTPNAYYTMCLDKAVASVKAGSIWKVLSKAQNGTDIILEEVTATEAGRPYIIYATETTFEVEYTGGAVVAPVNDAANNGLVGSFTEEPLAQNSNHYIIYNNALYYVNSNNVKVGAHRAYLNMLDVPAYSSANLAPGRRRVTMAAHGPQTATGIEDLNASEKPMKMMINGQIFILRGEKMYDTTGRLVK